MKAAQIVDLKRRWREQQDDVLFPDEVTVHSSSVGNLACCYPHCLYAPKRTTLDCQVSTKDRNASSHIAQQMDTPADIAARTRFAKFRGLRSWRSSPWDPKENLPREYARVFAFQAPTRAQRRYKLHWLTICRAASGSVRDAQLLLGNICIRSVSAVVQERPVL